MGQVKKSLFEYLQFRKGFIMVVNMGQRGLFLPPNHPKLVGDVHHTITNILVDAYGIYEAFSS